MPLRAARSSGRRRTSRTGASVYNGLDEQKTDPAACSYRPLQMAQAYIKGMTIARQI
jgi:hypothetical protein